MYVSDARKLTRLAPALRCVLIVDPHLASAKLMADIMKGLGAGEILMVQDEEQAMARATRHEPTLIVTERRGPRLDGERLTAAIRRSKLACRQAPVIMVTAEATASIILAARDSGVHEFLRKPFTAADIQRRVEAVALKPRDWIQGVAYVGPDRRRFNSGDYEGPKKRGVEQSIDAAA